jgi:biotin synthase
MEKLIDKLHQKHTLTAEEYRSLLLCEDTTTNVYLQKKAQQTTIDRFGNAVFIRGLIEISNRCRNNCLYCGIRKGNTMVSRYALSRETILSCCREGHALGFRTFVLQGGEDVSQTDDWVTETVSAVRKEFPDCAITLSLGEKSKEAYQRFFEAGANRYLLRHETFNETHYQELHPSEMSRNHRLRCLKWLKEIGYQTGTGIMVGSPGQTIDHLVEDLLFIERFHPEMIGIGPFIPHAETPFANKPAGSIKLTLKLLSILRLMHPSALIPATTALASLSSDGRERGILAGANVVMPNLSPSSVREKYSLYNQKAAFGSEAAEGLKLLEEQLNKIGYTISNERGDYNYV